jgi:hypothetical protein
MAPHILNLSARWSCTPRHNYPSEKEPGTRRTGGWVSPRAALGVIERRSCPAEDRTSVVQPVD